MVVDERGGCSPSFARAHRGDQQRVDWLRHSVRELAESQFDAPVVGVRPARCGDVHGRRGKFPCHAGHRCEADSLGDPQASWFVFACTNVEVDRLNAALRVIQRDRVNWRAGKHLHHPKLGVVRYGYASFQANGDPVFKLVVYTRC